MKTLGFLILVRWLIGRAHKIQHPTILVTIQGIFALFAVFQKGLLDV